MSDKPAPVSRFIEHKGIAVPAFFYGTAWKENQTEALTRLAIDSGFLAIDTANQRRHYYEEGVGKAVQQALSREKPATWRSVPAKQIHLHFKPGSPAPL